MTDRWAAALAASTLAGAAAARRLPLWLGALLAVLALARRRPALLCLGAALLASALGARAWAGLDPPPPGTPAAGVATLVTDPVEAGGALRVELRLGGRRVEAWARGVAASALRPLLAGERAEVRGRLSPVPERRRRFLAARHVAARLGVDHVGATSRGGALARLANDVRRTLVRGAASLPEDRRALFTGLVLGDDRGQDAATVDDFRAAGLSHLLAVSGQNVAFVLALAAPALRVLGLWGRVGAAGAVLVGFGVLTRWEPSVLRAVAMAGVALLATALGRPATTLRLLSLAATALVLVDPLLVGSVGFQLSCGACAGIAVLAAPLGRRLPLPVAVTLAAQAGVAPVLVPVFGGVPVASLPANLLAVPAAAPVMVWGLAAGLPAGLAGGSLAAAVHLPTSVLVGWIAGVARWAAALPLGRLGGGEVLMLAVLAVVMARAPRLRVPAAGAAVVVCLWTALAPPPPARGLVLDGGARLWRQGRAAVLVVAPRPRAGPLLGALRNAAVGGVGVVAVARAGDVRELGPVLDRHPARLVLTPATATVGTSVVLGRLRVDVVATAPRLVVTVAPCTFDHQCASASGPAATTSPPGRWSSPSSAASACPGASCGGPSSWWGRAPRSWRSTPPQPSTTPPPPPWPP